MSGKSAVKRTETSSGKKIETKSGHSQSKKRKSDIIFLNVVFCLLVIFIHTASEIVNNMPKNTSLFRTVFTIQKMCMFVVPGFILLSGTKMFLRKADNFSLAEYYASRFLRLIVPYVFWSAVYYLYFCHIGVYTFDFKDMAFRIISGDIWAHFYFVIVLIQFELLAPLWIFLYRRGSAAVHAAFAMLVTAICAQYLPSILTTVFPSMPDFNVSNCFLRYQVYWTAGCLIGKNYNEFCSYLKSNKLIILIGYLISAIIYVWLSLFTVGHEPVWMELFNMLYTSSAILMFYCLAQAFTGGASKILTPFAPIDRSTYTIYLVHCLIIVLVDRYMTSLGISNLTDRFALRLAAVYGICLVLCLVWQLIKLPIAKLIARDRGERIV